MRDLLIATNNAGKVREYITLLQDMPFHIILPSDLGLKLSVHEVGETFAENASLKAEAYSAASGKLTLADDSGLEVDALGGEPGVRSARFGGANRSDQERIQLLLSRLSDVPPARRTARFHCVIAVKELHGGLLLADGTCEGYIALAASGEHGFGYDPVFYLSEFGRTMAELSADEKNRVSHRARAAAEARGMLLCILQRKG